MDFTYYFAGFFALAIGFLGALIFIAAKGKSPLRFIAIASAVAFISDWVLLIQWANIGGQGAVLFLDFLFFAIYSVIGCSIGATPVLLLRQVWRKLSGQNRRAPISN